MVIETLRNKVKSIALNYYCLGIFALVLALLNWMSPSLISNLGPKILGKTVGPKAMEETLRLFSFSVSTILFILLGVALFSLVKIYRGMRWLDESLKKGQQKVSGLGQEMSHKASDFHSSMGRHQENLHKVLEEFKEQRQLMSSHGQNLQALLMEMKQIQSTFQAKDGAEVGLGIGPEGGIGTPFLELEDKVENLREDVFRAQMLAFNATIEVNKNEGGEHLPLLSSLAKEIEEILFRSERMIGAMRNSLEREREETVMNFEGLKKNLEQWSENWQKISTHYQGVAAFAEKTQQGQEEVQHLMEQGSLSSQFLAAWEEESKKMGEDLNDLAHDLKNVGRELEALGVSQQRPTTPFLPAFSSASSPSTTGSPSTPTSRERSHDRSEFQLPT